jgi:hypothetical protein
MIGLKGILIGAVIVLIAGVIHEIICRRKENK